MSCFCIGIGLTTVGIIVHIVTLILRSKIDPKNATNDNGDGKNYRIYLLLAVISVTISSIGYFYFAEIDSVTDKNYDGALTVLSILSAGLISGFYTFSFKEALSHRRIKNNNRLVEKYLPNLISIVFVVLFYFLFAVLSYYLGKSNYSDKIEGIKWVVPTFMGLLLLSNVFFDFWDYSNNYGESDK